MLARALREVRIWIAVAILEESEVKKAVNTRRHLQVVEELVLLGPAADGGASLTLVSGRRWATAQSPQHARQANL